VSHSPAIDVLPWRTWVDL